MLGGVGSVIETSSESATSPPAGARRRPGAIPTRVWRALVLSGGVAALVGIAALRSGVGYGVGWALVATGAVLVALGVGLGGAPTVARGEATVLSPLSRASESTSRGRLLAALAAWLLAAAIAWWAGGVLGRNFADYGALGAFVVALVVACLGGWLLDSSRRADLWPRLPRPGPPDVVAVLAVLAGAFLRVYRLDYFPPPNGLVSDETSIGLLATQMLVDPGFRPVYVPMGASVAFYQPVALAFEWLGPSAWAMRLPTALAGALTLAVFYPLARQVVRPWPAALATVLFAFCFWHLSQGRTAFDHGWAQMFGTAGFAVLLVSLRQRLTGHAALAGVIVGLGLYTYIGYRLVPVLALFFVWLCVLLRREHVPRAMVFTGALAATAYPLVLILLVRRDWITSRVNDIIGPSVGSGPAALTPQVFLARLMANLDKLVYAYGHSDWTAISLPDNTLLDPITFWLAVIGFGAALGLLRRPESGLILGTVVAILAAGGVLSFTVYSYRIYGLLPPLMVLVALGLAVLGRALRLGRATREWRGLAALVIVAPAAWMNYHAFFDVHVDDCRARNWYTHIGASVADYVRTAGAGRRATIFADFPWVLPTTEYLWLARAQHAVAAREPIVDLPLRSTGPAGALAVVTQPLDGLLVPELLRLYPGAGVMEVPAAEPACGNAPFYAVAVPPEQVDRYLGLARGESVGQPAWTGALAVPDSGAYRFGGEGLAIRVDGQALERSTAPAGSMSQSLQLHLGWHALEIRPYDPAGVGRFGLTWQRPEGRVEPVPPNAFAPAPYPHGMAGTYYRGLNPGGEPIRRSVDLPIRPRFGGEGPVAVIWQARLRIDSGGDYRFGIAGGREQTLEIDGRIVASNGAAATVDGAAEGAIRLEPGEHRLRLRLVRRDGDHGIRLTWTPPGGARAPVPLERLAPDWSGG